MTRWLDSDIATKTETTGSGRWQQRNKQAQEQDGSTLFDDVEKRKKKKSEGWQAGLNMAGVRVPDKISLIW